MRIVHRNIDPENCWLPDRFKRCETIPSGWSDITLVTVPFKPAKLLRRFPELDYCAKHQMLYYKELGCRKCEAKILGTEKWKGWY